MRDEDEWRRRGPFPPVTTDQIRQAAAEIAEYPGVQAVYLFGSRVWGSTRSSSDIDLAVWIEPCVQGRQPVGLASEMASKVEDRLGVATDVVLLSRDLPLGLLFDIFRVEMILWTRDAERAHDYACRARLAYRDELPRFDRNHASVVQRSKERARALDRA